MDETTGYLGESERRMQDIHVTRSWSMSRWRWLRVSIAVLIAVILILVSVTHAKADTVPTIVYTQNTCTLIRSQPNITAPPISDLMGGTGLRVTGQSGDGLWYQVAFLGNVTAWVIVSNVRGTPPANANVDGACTFPNAPDSPSDPITSAPGPFALSEAGTVTQPTALRSSPAMTARVVASIVPGVRAFVSQYAGDANGDIWYLAHVQGQIGWLWAYTLRFDGPDPATYAVNGKPVWSKAAGKGMWFTNYFPRHTDIDALISSAKAAGITHLYPEVAISTFGFYGRATLDRLVPAAHAAGISIIAAVYPYLKNVAADLAMTRAVVDYRTANGDKVDGISADIEERTDPPPVYAYGQVLRQMVGPETILVVTPYNPRARVSYPFPEIAASFNVISPQDYWHNDRNTTYTPNDARALLLYSIATIRAELGGKVVPIEELGQSFDMLTGDGTPGGAEPSGAEIAADMQAAKEFGCIGVSYFEWQTASPDELDVFNAFHWS